MKRFILLIAVQLSLFPAFSQTNAPGMTKEQLKLVNEILAELEQNAGPMVWNRLEVGDLEEILKARISAEGMSSFKPNWKMILKAEKDKRSKEVTKKIGSNISKIRISGLRGKIILRTHKDNSIVLRTSDDISLPKKAAGLRPVSSMGSDNTGLGLETKEHDGVLHLSGVVHKAVHADFEIWVPVRLAIDFKNPMHSDKVTFMDVSKELSIEAGSSITLEKVTGPVTANVTHGNITAKYDAVNQKMPNSFTCRHGDIDISLPKKTKANLDFNVHYGDIYTDFDYQPQGRTENSERGSHNQSKFRATINGGGVKFVLRGQHGNVYLRKE
ncbi:hypothetical protein FUAX_29850 [Fulvitalea axinellae]|uniref:DUF4097 domain-containing protein n=1 Tax=Fulvitalea axinellae TaxID=1182444 RepID=A0AAU9D3L8_9BACT|nr:hypothetical protein FUAX_29850 [Fulvitalea axinellae]